MTEGYHALRFSWRSFGLWVGPTTMGFILARPFIHIQADGTTALRKAEGKYYNGMRPNVYGVFYDSYNL